MNNKKRFRDFGFIPGFLKTGILNTIADVPGVLIGHATKIEGRDIRTGVTLIDPGVSNLFHDKIPAAIAVGNGFGKLAGSTQVEELGTIEAPIALTNTLAVGPVLRGVVDLVIAASPTLPPFASINAVVGETNDFRLNNIHLNTVTDRDVQVAWNTRSAHVALGNVGAGTGTRAFAWKGGIGSASRVITINDRVFTIGALLQINFGGALTIMGVSIGKLLNKTDFDDFLQSQIPDGSCMIVLATDAPLTARQLQRIAQRAFFGLARTGSIMAHASGDYAIAFSTNRAGIPDVGLPSLPDDTLNPFFLGAIEAVEESVYEALFAAETLTGRDGNVLHELPVLQVVEFLRKKLL